MSAQTIADKFRRALRNETGATFTLEQMREMASFGVLQRVSDAECQELLSGFEVQDHASASRSCRSAEVPPETDQEASGRARSVSAKRGREAATGGARHRGHLDISVLSKGL